MSDGETQRVRRETELLSDNRLAEMYLMGPHGHPAEFWQAIEQEFTNRGGVVEDVAEALTDQLVTVFTCTDSTELIMARMLLETSGIPLVVKGAGVQDLFGCGRIAGGINLLTGPVQIQVPESHAQTARTILEEIG